MHVFKDDVMDADVNNNATLNAIRTLYGPLLSFGAQIGIFRLGRGCDVDPVEEDEVAGVWSMLLLAKS